MNRYEALGRYTLAVKQFAMALTKRNDQLEDIARLCLGGLFPTCLPVRWPGGQQAGAALPPASMQAADANAVAPKANQPPLNLQEHPHVD